MIRFGLRLAVASGREAVARLGLIAGAVALGVAMLLVTLAGVRAVDEQNARYAWLNTGAAAATGGTADPAWWLLRSDRFRDSTIVRVDVAVTGDTAPVPPGIPRLPAAGEFYASPALTALLRTTPRAELGDRFPGRQAGTIGPAALPGPQALVVIVGRAPAELAGNPDARRFTSIVASDSPDCARCWAGNGADALKLLLGVIATAVLFPVLILIATATRLAAARREERFAAMRLVGATPAQVSTIATVESTLSAALGTVAGAVLFLLVRPLLAGIEFTETPFYPADLTVGPPAVAAVVLGVPALAAVSARVALRRVRISPLGVVRRVTPRPPRAWRLLPLALGVAELAWFIGRRPQTSNGQLVAFLSGLVLMMVGLVVAGPWLTMVGSRLLARRSGRPAPLSAGRRLADNPRAGFRAVSGLMLALFVTSVATGVITTIVAHRGPTAGGDVYRTAVEKYLAPDRVPAGQRSPTVADVPPGLRSMPGVRSVTVVHANPVGIPEKLPGLVPCSVLAADPALGRCEAGAEVAEVSSGLVDHRPDADPTAPPRWPTASVPADGLDALPLLSLVVHTDGSAATVERARTALTTAFPDGIFATTAGEWESDFAQTLVRWQRLADVVVVTSLVIAGCSLAVSVAGGISERRRPFSLLRLTGVQMPVLRRVLLLESAVPLLLVAAIAVGSGFLAAHLFLTAQLDYTLQPPGAAYYLTVAAGLVGSLAIIASTLPLLRRTTAPQAARTA